VRARARRAARGVRRRPPPRAGAERPRRGAAGARERELDLLEWELGEIAQAAPSEAEEAALLADRERLRHLEALRAAAGAALAALEGEEHAAGGAVGTLAAAVSGLDSVASVDAELDGLGARLRALYVEADDLMGELRRYGESVGAEAEGEGRLDAVEERLAALERLKRKHGGTIAAVLAHAEACRRRRAELTGADEALADAEVELAAAREELARRAGELRAARAEAAPRLAAAVRERLAGLAMDHAAFEVALRERDGHGPAGADEVEFRIAANPGVPAGPLGDIASGGELSRVMLALMSVAAEAGPPTLVFDEVDAGIGGQTARAVGEALRALAAGRQVLCITHLPQIASLADRHFTIVKDASGATARTTVSQLAKGAVVGELVRMLGAESDDRAARRHARELLRAA